MIFLPPVDSCRPTVPDGAVRRPLPSLTNATFTDAHDGDSAPCLPTLLPPSAFSTMCPPKVYMPGVVLPRRCPTTTEQPSPSPETRCQPPARESNVLFDEASWATFHRIHYKNGQYTAGRPVQHRLEVERRLGELRQTQEEVTPSDVDRIFREVVTPDPRGRIMGLGMMMLKAITESGESSSTHSTSTSWFPFSVASKAEVVTLREELEVRKQKEEAQSKVI
ncbi:uncharacterized protein LOC130990499 [Salvia miltiorrhiza]|uniref:uncharacterized protein LOC130990499 n=1 Tax=Salvia miltiorrhiza TaxID=226208 RepID=UPI0025ACD2E9|nr:uncharacterized protein LOC130990499 [Salvia miltiorrhiza]